MAGIFWITALILSGACDPDASTRNTQVVEDTLAITGRLAVRPAAPTKTVIAGLQVQRITNEGRPFGLFVPANYDASRAWPVVVLLHGAGGSGEGMALEFSQFATNAGLIIVAPNSYYQTWDLIYSATQSGQAIFGPDRAYIDNLLRWTFDHLNVDPTRLGIAGFDDGAVYALWLGLKNGDLFTRVGAFSPCSNVPTTTTGLPLIFVSHSQNDQLAPIDVCSRNMVPRLQSAGYTVDFVEYPTSTGNGHFMTPEVMAEAMQFFGKK